MIDAARPCRHPVGNRWFVDETYVKIAGIWRYVYRAIDEHGQVIDIYVSTKREISAARKFFAAMLNASDEPEEIITDRAASLANVIEELLPGSIHNTEKYANNRVECDHGRLKARLRPMLGLKRYAPQVSSYAATRSYRTCAATITNLASMQGIVICESRRHSTNLQTRSNPKGNYTNFTRLSRSLNATVPYPAPTSIHKRESNQN